MRALLFPRPQRSFVVSSEKKVMNNNYMAELVCAEKELSDWFPERYEFSYTDH